MAAIVTHVYERREMGAGRNRKRKYWDVTLSEYDPAGADIALAAPGIPQDGDEWPVPGAGLVVVERDADLSPESRGGTVWRVTIEYGVNTNALDYSGTQAPWNRPHLITWENIAYRVAMTEDVSNPPVPVLNAAGDPFQPAIERTIRNRVARVRFARMSSLYDPDDAAELIDTVNGSSILLRNKTIAANTAALIDTNAAEDVYRGTRYWNIEHVIEIQRQWPVKYIRVLNAGYHQLVDGKRQPCTVDDPGGGKRMVSSPVPLDQDGKQLGVGATPTFLTFQIREPASWGALKL